MPNHRLMIVGAAFPWQPQVLVLHDLHSLFFWGDRPLDIVTWPIEVKGASITLAQEVKRGDAVLVKAEVRVAFISGGRAQPIPKSLRTLLKADLL